MHTVELAIFMALCPPRIIGRAYRCPSTQRVLPLPCCPRVRRGWPWSSSLTFSRPTKRKCLSTRKAADRAPLSIPPNSMTAHSDLHEALPDGQRCSHSARWARCPRALPDPCQTVARGRAPELHHAMSEATAAETLHYLTYVFFSVSCGPAAAAGTGTETWRWSA